MARKKKEAEDVPAEPEVQEPAPVDPQASRSVIRRAYPRSVREFNSAPVMVISLDEASKALSESAFMRPTFERWTREALMAGSIFTLEREGEPAVDYKLATKQDLIDLATEGVRQTTIRQAVRQHIASASEAPAAPGTPPVNENGSRPRRAPSARKVSRANTLFVFTIPPPGKKRDERLNQLKSKQARAIMDIIVESGQAELNQEALTHILEEGAAAKGLDKEHVYRRFFRFAFTPGYEVYQGLVERK